ncbi:MAG TPA: hypothetical protein H9723_09275 [Candidatus Mediterraneibacter stercoravium]|uniref:HTH cro/C1-type domain-containing protein n=1 Tax=Candidatus Mediterraneibacter stercoravium TaxID=2838685 RepID=A0A9D2K2D1_9FIRM|nr:hypothetical protein [Candidatus Mediterraneibacter stercoravium]
MPRSMVRNIPEEQNCIFRGSIKNLMEIRRTNVPEVARKAGMKESTLYAKIRDPAKLTLRELRSLYKALQVPDEEKERIAREAM